ncbi:hypothetical protein [Agromyces albus]|uniref:hypothetical protein n=1 Tax=Agromyces albus TaxID=205332 RepID=UPI002784D77C|nr:hypothetical protein [Agromyces albus]MDQ0577649.1 hypothetical protein [Agromyces albus]
MSDINTPDPREHTEAPAEGPDDATAQPNDIEHAAPDEDMAFDIQPPPTEESEVPGVPDASDALDEDGSDEPGANATGIGV